MTRGALALVFGAIAFAYPAVSWSAFVVLFGTYALADSVVLISSALYNRAGVPARWAFLLSGTMGFLLGAVVLGIPGLVLSNLRLLIAAWAVACGITHVAATIRLQEDAKTRWLLGLVGALSVALGVVLAVGPVSGRLDFTRWIGTYAVLSGVTLTALGLRLRRRAGQRSASSPSRVA